MVSWHTISVFVGGIGLFLLGMRLLTEGLKLVAGRMLREVLERSTGTKLRALVTGILFTSLVQSSSAVTVASIGFVNAGLLALEHAVWVIFGSNVGTTMTGWIVAATGMSLDLEVYSLPAIGLGMLLTLTGPTSRRGAMGEVLAGFGLFFLGLTVLHGTFAELAENADLGQVAISGWGAGLLYFAIGTLLTVAMQSSSAALAVTLTAASSGLIELQAAGAMVIGANLGTTSTAAFAVLDATPNARRTAAAHVMFNVLAATVALTLLPWLLQLLQAGLAASGQRPAIAAVLALFHTTFNVLGVIIIWPLSGPMLRYLGRRFRTREEQHATPRHLDRNVLAVPAVALTAVALEMHRVGHMAARLVRVALRPGADPIAPLAQRRSTFDSLMADVTRYMASLDRKHLPEEVAAGLQALLRASQHYMIVAEQAAAVVQHRLEAPTAKDASIDVALGPFLQAAVDLVDHADPEHEAFGLAPVEQRFGVLQERYDRAIEGITTSAVRGEIEMQQALWQQHLMSEVRRAAKHLVRAAEALRKVPVSLRQVQPPAEAADREDAGAPAAA